MSILPFDGRDGSIWIDGALVPWRDAKLHVLSHGLHYGGAVFESGPMAAGSSNRARMRSGFGARPNCSTSRSPTRSTS